MSFYTDEELGQLGFKRLGKDVKISRRASIHNAQNIEVGDCTRIDDFCVLSAGVGGIIIGRHVHVAIHSSLIGAGQIKLNDFSNVSSRVSIYSSNDDYSGEFLTNPTVPETFTDVKSEPVIIGRHVIIGSGSVILPGVTMAEGSATGALTLIRHDCEAFTLYCGVPARKIGPRSRKLLELENRLAEIEKGQK